MEAETSLATAERLDCLVTKLEASEKALKERNAELENFHDIVVGRELKMSRLEKEIERLQQEVTRLTSLLPKP